MSASVLLGSFHSRVSFYRRKIGSKGVELRQTNDSIYSGNFDDPFTRANDGNEIDASDEYSQKKNSELAPMGDI